MKYCERAICCLLSLIWLLSAVPVTAEEGQENLSSIRIHMVMTSNPSLCLKIAGNYYDWLELVNRGEATVSLKDWILTDTPDMKHAYMFQDVALQPDEALIVYCAKKPAGYEGDEIFTGFSLSRGGETLILMDSSETQRTILDLPAMEQGEVYELDEETGAYSVRAFAQSSAHVYGVNTEPAFDPDTVILNEVMPSNKSTLQDEDGSWPDWIELCNGGSETVSLEGWALSDDETDPFMWVFPDVAIEPGEYVIVFASGKDRRQSGSELHTNFKLSRDGESVRLYYPDGTVASWISYTSSVRDRSISRRSDGSIAYSAEPTPGYGNGEKRVQEPTEVVTSPQPITTNAEKLYINEVQAHGTGDDWVELVNEGDETVRLSDCWLSDDPERPRGWNFPEGAEIAPGQYVVITLTGKGGETGGEGKRYSADFALSEGESVVLSRTDGIVVDSIALTRQYWGISYGRAAGYANYRYFEKSTPGAANASDSYAGRADEVTFSVPGGLQQGSSVTLSLSADAGMDIYYTTDGTDPTPKSAVYTEPISVDGNTVVKAVSWGADVIPSLTAAQTYLFGVSHDLRVVCVSGPRDKLNSSTGMLNTGTRGNGTDVYVEMYEPDGTQIIGQKCLMVLAGHGSRTDMAQKGFSLRAKGKYGASVFAAPLFSNRDYTEYKSIFMRASGQDSQKTHMRDSVLTSLAADTNVMYQETELTVLYVNGVYWGEYNLRERISVESIAQFEGWSDPDDVVLLEGSGGGLRAIQGSTSAYAKLIAQVKKQDFTDDATVEALRAYVDIENYLDYVALQIYTSNQDLNNVRCYCNPREDGRWKWILFDLDLSFEVDANSISRWLQSGGVGSVTSQDNTLFIALMKNANVRKYFLKRMGELLATTLSGDHVAELFTERGLAMYNEMEYTTARWGWTMSTWKKKVAKVIEFAKARPGKLIGYFKTTMKLSDAEMEEYFGDAMRAIQNAKG